jgi:hypothetical protein
MLVQLIQIAGGLTTRMNLEAEGGSIRCSLLAPSRHGLLRVPDPE